MKRENLSKHATFFNLVHDGENGPEYWAGADDWVKDPGHPDVSVLTTQMALKWVDRFVAKAIQVRLQHAEHTVTFTKWKDVGWITISAVTGMAHRVKFVNSRGAGWFMKDEGTVERMLCINHSAIVYSDIVIRGEEIGDVTVWVSGEALTDFTTISIPPGSNLIYQFEIEVDPVDLGYL